ncbi:MAG: TlpA disulfide reductase family protein [Bacteroidota bacterium]
MIYPRVLPLFFLFIGLLSCQQTQENEESARLTVTFSDDKPSDIKIGTIHPFDFSDSLLAEAKLDTLDTDTIELVINLPKTTLAYLKVDENWHQLYLTSGDDLTISVGTEGEDQVVQFAGRGSKVNDYLNTLARLHEDFIQRGGTYAWQLEPEAFMARLDSTRVAYEKFHQAFTDTVTLPENLDTLLLDRSRLALISLKENYDLVQYPAQMENDIPPEEIIQEESEYSYYEVPFDPSYLNNSLLAYEYAVALSMYSSLHIGWPAYNSLQDKEDPDSLDKMPLIADRLVRSKNYPAKIKEFLVARNVLDYLGSQGITPQVDTILRSFKQDYPASDYIEPIETEYEKWLTIAPGQPAPEITGTTPEGERLSLSNLRGKVIYVDIWATWCGPCIEEFPHSRELAEEFSSNDEVVFLYVSVDREENDKKWKKMVTDNNLMGVNIRETPKSEESSIWKTYLIHGVPRYMLIDQHGKIVDAEADRPSSGKVTAKIQNLLSGQQKAGSST